MVGDVVTGAGLRQAAAVKRGALERGRPAGTAPISEGSTVHKPNTGGVECRDLRAVGKVSVLRLQGVFK